MSEALENKIETTVKEKPYTFRPLEAEDAFLMCTIIKTIGIKEFKACFEGGGVQEMVRELIAQNNEKNDENLSAEGIIVKGGIAVFLDLADVIIGNLPKCKNEIFEMLSSVSNLTEEEVRKLGFADFFAMIIDFFKKEEFRDFFKVVSALL